MKAIETKLVNGVYEINVNDKKYVVEKKDSGWWLYDFNFWFKTKKEAIQFLSK